MWIRGVVFVTVLLAAAATLTRVGVQGAAASTPRPAQCAPVHGRRWSFPAKVTVTSSSYESFARGVSCASAGAWTRQLSRQRLPKRAAGSPNPLRGVPGFTCIGYPDRSGYAYAGSCWHGSSAEFGWNWNVMYRPITTGYGNAGVEQLATTGSDAQTMLRAVGHGRYELQVSNISSIGFITSFRWTPPAGLTVTAVTGRTARSCNIATDGSIVCHGHLKPPKCLCDGSGGTTVIEFTAKGSLSGGGQTKLLALSPVPYLIPSTPEQAQNAKGL